MTLIFCECLLFFVTFTMHYCSVSDVYQDNTHTYTQTNNKKRFSITEISQKYKNLEMAEKE